MIKSLAEIITFGGLAVSIHLAFALQLQDGGDAGGTDGTELVTLVASAAQVETMVAHWQRPPDITTDTRRPETPARDAAPTVHTAPDLPVLRNAALTLPSATRSDARKPQIDFSTPPPDVAPPDVAAKAPAKPAQTTPDVAQTPNPSQIAPDTAAGRPPSSRPLSMPPMSPDAAPQAETTPPSRPKPAKREPPAQKPKQATPANSAQTASDGAASQRAAGSGGTAQAGSTRQSKVATRNAGTQTSLIQAWGSKVRARVERRKAYPRGNHGSGRVVVGVTISPEGRVLSSRIIRSSGVAALDRAALRAVSGRMPRAPKGLTKGHSYSLPLNFKKN